MNDTKTILCLPLFLMLVVAISVIPLSYAEFPAPAKQIKNGVAPEDIQCNENRVLAIRDNGAHVCVTEKTALKMDWDVIATEFEQTMISPHQKIQITDKIEKESAVVDETSNNDDGVEQQTKYIEMDLGSDVEYVSDGREIHSAKQKRPAPLNIYERIIDSQKDYNIDSNGLMRVPAGFAHEKYSVVPGMGFYPADWMPTHVPDGYKLLYITNYNYEDTTGDARLNIYFVPNTFKVTNQTTTLDVNRSHGFRIYVSYTAVGGLDEIEDAIENIREYRESKSGYVGRWLDVQRDGKAVWAEESQYDINPYQSTYSFYANDKTIMSVLSYYHTLEELKPIFDSVMN